MLRGESHFSFRLIDNLQNLYSQCNTIAFSCASDLGQEAAKRGCNRALQTPVAAVARKRCGWETGHNKTTCNSLHLNTCYGDLLPQGSNLRANLVTCLHCLRRSSRCSQPSFTRGLFQFYAPSLMFLFLFYVNQDVLFSQHFTSF